MLLLPPPKSARVSSPALLPRPHDLHLTGLPTVFSRVTFLKGISSYLNLAENPPVTLHGAQNEIQTTLPCSQRALRIRPLPLSLTSTRPTLTISLLLSYRSSFSASIIKCSPVSEAFSVLFPLPGQETTIRGVKRAGSGARQGRLESSFHHLQIMCQVTSTLSASVSSPVKSV